MKIRNTEIKIVQGDIADLTVDAIVCPSNQGLLMASGLAAEIKLKGGEVIAEEAEEKGPAALGQAVITNAGRLDANYIIHAVMVDADKKTTEHMVRQACAESLKLAHEFKCHSIAIPALGCGIGGFSDVGAAKIISQEILKFLKFTDTLVYEIVICLLAEETFHIFDQTVSGYVTHVQDTLGNGPYVTVDIIIELEEGIILIERSNPPYGWALPGGFVDYGETLETAAAREAKEETNMELTDLRQFHAYSDPARDPRFHTVSTVFVAQGRGQPQFGDDAKGLKVIKYRDLLSRDYAFDHKKVIADYLKTKKI